jgi:DNA-binding MarR family transcriptional regulator
MDKAEAITKRQELWGDALSYGFVGVPTLLLKHQGDLQISPQEMVVLMNLLASWWKAGNLPFPRTTTIASRSGLSVRVVQRQLLSLEQKGLITRLANQSVKGKPELIVTRYDPRGLVKRLQELSKLPQKADVPVQEKNKEFLAGRRRPAEKPETINAAFASTNSAVALPKKEL